MKCAICLKEVKRMANHAFMAHNLTSKEYYDTYIKIGGYCKVCGKETKYAGIKRGYRKYCSYTCNGKSDTTKQKRINTNLEKYGYKNTFTLVHDEAIAKARSPESREKAKNTTLQHYGVPYPLQVPEIHIKCQSEMAKQKAYNTKKKNNSFVYSRLEEYLKNELIKLGVLFYRQYKSEEYPFRCDFYIPDKKLYIEINGHWTHGEHIFDPTDKKDIQQLDKWKSKAKTSDFYKNAVKVWTHNDILKKNTAIKNNLNYIILWNKDDIDKFILTIK